MDDHKCAFTRPHLNNMVTSLVGDLVQNNRVVWRDVLTNEDSRPASVHVVRDERTKHPRLSEPAGRVKNIFPKRFLKADVVLVDQPFEAPVLLLSGDLEGCGAKKPSRIPRYTTKASFGNMDTFFFS